MSPVQTVTYVSGLDICLNGTDEWIRTTDLRSHNPTL